MTTTVVTIRGNGPLGLKLVAFHGGEENLCAKVASVKPNSNAFKANIFPGALICAVNGVAVEGLRYNEVLTKIKEASQSRPFDLTLKRQKKLANFTSSAKSEHSTIGTSSTAMENKQKNASNNAVESTSNTNSRISVEVRSADSGTEVDVVPTDREANKVISPARENKVVKSVNTETTAVPAKGDAQDALASLQKQLTLKLQQKTKQMPQQK